MRVAAIQMNSGPDVRANLRKLGELVTPAADAGARMIVLPENVALMPSTQESRVHAAEVEGEGPIQTALADLARKNRIWLIGGTIPLKVPGESERVAPALLVFNPDGKVVARYDKIHLFDVEVPGEARRQYRESDDFVAGSEVRCVQVDDVCVGLSICYDLRFPELYRLLVDQGAQVLVAPSAFTAQTGRAHWDLLLRARAVENLAFIIGPNQTGVHPRGHQTWGHSKIIDPWGRTLAAAETMPGFVLADLDLELQRQTRTRFPVLTHRRIGRIEDA
ncbi:carbon-nitrogen hydrolase family protein [uncultured Abyssibacter sp.]|uniref:carbon-nitrogen hydrolase family protein n=1 Tax=uncultured Abyssibacter sp. TaxID=2320202 RepID=UPI0032B2C132